MILYETTLVIRSSLDPSTWSLTDFACEEFAQRAWCIERSVRTLTVSKPEPQDMPWSWQEDRNDDVSPCTDHRL